jgi:hypothetical protein
VAHRRETPRPRRLPQHHLALGNASVHDTRNLPLLLAGGGFKHGRRLAVDPQKNVFSDLFVTLAQRMGVETERFGFSNGRLDPSA